MPSSTELLGPEHLRQHQAWMSDAVYRTPGLLLASYMGSGKTVSVLTAIRRQLDEFAVHRVLVVAPLLVAETTWPDEIAKWRHTRVLTYEVITGSEQRRLNRLKIDADIHIINRENIPWLWKTLKDDWPYDWVVWDESGRLKAGKKRTSGGKKVREDGTVAKPRLSEFGAICAARKHIRRVTELTGTPAPNGLQDLWGQVYLLDQGERLGKTRTAFESRWFQKDYMGYKITPFPHSEEQIMGRIKDVMLCLKEEDYADLPPLIVNRVNAPLPPKAMKGYKDFERTLVAEEYDVEAVSKGVLTNKLLQFCLKEGTPVLCRRGWVPIEEVGRDDEVWDGVEFVATSGVVYKGEKPVVECYGVEMTSDHQVLTERGWRTAGDVNSGDASERPHRAEVRLPGGAVARGPSQKQSFDLAMPMHLREGSCSTEHVPAQPSAGGQEVVRMPARGNAGRGVGDARHDRTAAVGDLAGLEAPVSGPEGQRFQKLWRPRDRHAGRLVRLFRSILERCARGVPGRPDLGSAGQRKGLQPRKLPMGVSESAGAKHPNERPDQHPVGANDSSRSGGEVRHQGDHHLRPGEERLASVSNSGACEKARVYDLMDCGPRHRFVVRGSSGPLIVHNCNGSLYNEEGEDLHVHDAKIKALESIVEEAAGQPILVAYSFQFDLKRILKKFPRATVLRKKDPDAIRRWNAGEIDMLLVHPASAGHGLNLQAGGNIAVWFGLNWSLELYQQFNKRLHRDGQKRKVFLHHIVAPGTADENVLEALRTKGATQDSVTNAVRVRLKKAG